MYRVAIIFPNWPHFHKVLFLVCQAKLSLLYHVLFLEARLFSVEEIIHQTHGVCIFFREVWQDLWDVNSVLPTAFVLQQRGGKMEIKMYCSRGKGIGSKYCYLKKKKSDSNFCYSLQLCFSAKINMAVLCLIISLPYLLVRTKNNSHFTDELNHHFLRQREEGKCSQLFPWMLVSIFFCCWKVDGQYYFSWQAMLSQICQFLNHRSAISLMIIYHIYNIFLNIYVCINIKNI